MRAGRSGVAHTMRAFSITWDYRCPFARNAGEHVVAGIRAGADWDATFVPFSLGQVHVEAGETAIWERPADDSGLLALQVGVAVRDLQPHLFADVHVDLFALRHDHGGNLRDRSAIGDVLSRHGADVAAIFAQVDEGRALTTVRDDHETAANRHHVWGVPTFIRGDRAVFVRLMDRPGEDERATVATVERILDTMDHFVALNEFKHTTVAR